MPSVNRYYAQYISEKNERFRYPLVGWYLFDRDAPDELDPNYDQWIALCIDRKTAFALRDLLNKGN